MPDRFSKVLERALRKAGWSPGRQTDVEIKQLDFQLHLPGIRFLTEFGRLNIGGTLFTDAYYINRIYKHHARLASACLPNCLPVALSWYWCEGELWMDDLGRIYQADDDRLALVSETVEEALEILIIRQKEIPEHFPKWNIGSRPRNPYDLGVREQPPRP